MIAVMMVLGLFAALFTLAGLVVMGVWNWTIVYLAWALFRYSLPHMTLWEGMCAYFVIAVVWSLLDTKVDDDDDDF